MTGSQAVVLDRADLLDVDNRWGLEQAVQRVSGKTGIAVLLCSTGVADGTAPWKQVTITGGDDGMRITSISISLPMGTLSSVWGCVWEIG